MHYLHFAGVLTIFPFRHYYNAHLCVQNWYELTPLHCKHLHLVWIYYYSMLAFIKYTAVCWSFRKQEREIEPRGSAECSTALRRKRYWRQRANPAHGTFTVPQPSQSLRLHTCLDLWPNHRLAWNITLFSLFFICPNILNAFLGSLQLRSILEYWTYSFDPGTWVNKGIGSVRMERNGLVWTYVAPHLGNWIAAPSPTSNGMKIVTYSQMTHKHIVCNLCLDKVTTGLLLILKNIAIMLVFW